jgi:uncharacterized RDD family membrane protein YckC
VTAGVGRLGQLGSATSGLVIDRVLAGPLPEAVARSLVEHRVLQRMLAEILATDAVDEQRAEKLVREVLASPAVERVAAAAADSGVATELTERVLRSPQFRRVLEEVLSSPEVRRALTQQTTTIFGELVARTRQRAVALDDRILSRARRAEAPAGVPYAGVATRGVALVADAALTNALFVLGGALVGLVASLFGELRPAWLVAVLAGGAWLALVGTYFVVFWSALGQTPGMRLMRVRVVAADGAAPEVGRSVLRLIGLVLAIVPLFAGFLPALFDRRRRALPDYFGGTTVVYEERA